MTTQYRRDRHKLNRYAADPLRHPEHVPGERCLVCKPLPLTAEQRMAKAVQAEQRAIEAVERTDYSRAQGMRALLGASVGRIVPRRPEHHGEGLRPRRRGGRRSS